MAHAGRARSERGSRRSSANAPPDSACACRDGRSVPSARSRECGARFRRCHARARSSAVPSGMASELGVAVASAATDSVEAAVCTAAIFGSSSFGLLESFGVTTRSGSSASVGVSFGSSVSLTSAFCSASAGEATDASVSGPGGRSVGSRLRRGQFAGRSRSQARRARRRHRRSADARSPAPRRRGEARARQMPAKIHSRRDGFCSVSRSDITIVRRSGLRSFWRAGAGAAASGTPSSATSLIFE